MLIPLELLLIAELASPGNGAILRLDVDGVGADRLAFGGRIGAGDARSAEARDKPFEITLLLWRKVAGHL